MRDRSLSHDRLRWTEGVTGLFDRGSLKDLIAVDDVYEQAEAFIEGWSNVPMHCLLVAQVADKLADLSRVVIHVRNDLILAALFHDVLKVKERNRARELQATGLSQADSFTKAAEEQADWLTSIKIDQRVIDLSKLSGHTSLAHFKFEEGTLIERIFHLADDLCGGEDGTEVVMIADRMAILAVRYPWLKAEGQDKLDGETYYEAQERIANAILDEAASIAGMSSGESLNAILVKEFCGWDSEE